MSPHPNLQYRVTRLDNARHHGGLRPGRTSLIVMHTTDGASARSTIDYLNTTDEKTASYHYLIDRDGDVLRMVAPNLVAFHAGDSAWPNPRSATKANPERPNGGMSVNRISLGIAWANTGESLTDLQLESGLWLAGMFVAINTIPVDRVLGHYEVSPVRKKDPMPAQEMGEFRALLTKYLAE